MGAKSRRRELEADDDATYALVFAFTTRVCTDHRCRFTINITMLMVAAGCGLLSGPRL